MFAFDAFAGNKKDGGRAAHWQNLTMH